MLLSNCSMNFFAKLFSKRDEEETKTEADYQRETLINLGKQQFQRMKDLGIRMPVTLA